ncbi:MAG: DsbC family protein [Betaproteobacteria bacterium]|nr:DsbC family protein [Betaproteobacteria bacterium]
MATAITTFAMAAPADEQAIRQALKSRIPNAQILSIQKLPYAGLYEVAVRRGTDTAIYYSDALGQIMIVGNLIEMRTDRNLTEERLRKLSATDWNQLPFHWAVITRRGDGRRQIAILSDPNCPFCQKFEKDLATLDNITIHIFMWPVVKEESVRQTKSVWCSKDRAKAWNELMLKRVEPTAPTDCENPIDRGAGRARETARRNLHADVVPAERREVCGRPADERRCAAARRHGAAALGTPAEARYDEHARSRTGRFTKPGRTS